ncbi:MAG: hypothetical protein AAGF31_00510, partial [Planctomycetota bacterium]
WKALLLISFLVWIGGCATGLALSAGADLDSPNPDPVSALGGLFMFVGALGFFGVIAARLGAWWYHG